MDPLRAPDGPLREPQDAPRAPDGPLRESQPQSPLTVHHVGIAVPSIDDAMHFYGEKLGLSVVESVDMPERQLKVAFVQAANVLIELLEPTDIDSTVSRFIEGHALGRLHVTICPIFIGRGRPGISLPAIDDLGEALRPRTRRFDFGDDVLFDCRLDQVA